MVKRSANIKNSIKSQEMSLRRSCRKTEEILTFSFNVTSIDTSYWHKYYLAYDMTREYVIRKVQTGKDHLDCKIRQI